MKASELREKSAEELVTLEAELRRDLINLRVAAATGGDVQTGRFREIKRDVARIKTIQTARQQEK